VPQAFIHDGNAASAALRNVRVNLFSDLLLHDMGAGLAEDLLNFLRSL
jgi:CxxC motif-containing protein (DUF1111 family)